MNFDTLTVPTPCTDHSLMHNTIRRGNLGQKGLQVRFRKKHPFRAIFVGYSTRLLALRSILCNIPDVDRLLVEDIWRGFHSFFDHMVHVSGLFRAVYVPLQLRIIFPNGSQNDAFRHSDGPSSTYRPSFNG
jgi:hypothetical protein